MAASPLRATSEHTSPPSAQQLTALMRKGEKVVDGSVSKGVRGVNRKGPRLSNTGG